MDKQPDQAEAQAKSVPEAVNWRLLEEACASYFDADELDLIRHAYSFASDYHKNQRRRSGEPYINHPVEVALILASDLHMDADSIAAALLHDTVEDTEASLDELTECFGTDVAELVDGVTKLTNIEVSSMDERQALNLRKMFLAMSKDIRVVIIKLADRLHNMRTLAALKPERRLFKARETMDVYAPLADRLGMSNVKWELEDLAFFWLLPEEYERIARMVQDSRAQREADICWLKEHYPEAAVLPVCARNGEGLEALSQALTQGQASMRRPDIGYGGAAFRHAMGKISEFYIQYRAVVCCKDFDGNAYLLDTARAVQGKIREAGQRIPHLKLLAWEPEGDFGKVDLIGTEREIEVTRRFERPCTDIAVLLNASAACPVDTLEEILVSAMHSVSDRYQLELTVFKKEGLAMGE